MRSRSLSLLRPQKVVADLYLFLLCSDYGRAPRRYDDRERYASDRPRSRSPYYSSSMDRPAPYTSSSSGWGDSTGRSRAYDDPY